MPANISIGTFQSHSSFATCSACFTMPNSREIVDGLTLNNLLSLYSTICTADSILRGNAPYLFFIKAFIKKVSDEADFL